MHPETAASELEGLNQSESLYLIIDVPASMLESSDAIAKLVRMADRLSKVSHVVLQLPSEGEPAVRTYFSPGYYAANIGDFDANHLEIVHKNINPRSRRSR